METKERMKLILGAIDDLVEAAYDTGYDSGIPGSTGQSWSTMDIRKRDGCKETLISMIEELKDDLTSELEEFESEKEVREKAIEELLSEDWNLSIEFEDRLRSII